MVDNYVSMVVGGRVLSTLCFDSSSTEPDGERTPDTLAARGLANAPERARVVFWRRQCVRPELRVQVYEVGVWQCGKCGAAGKDCKCPSREPKPPCGKNAPGA